MKRWLPGLAALALLLAAACGPRPQTAPSEPLRNAAYEGQALPDRVEGLSGIALFDADLENQLLNLGADAPAEARAFFVLLAAKDPTKGVLVRAAARLPEGMGVQGLNKVTVTGDLQTLKASSLVAYFQEKQGISLARTAEGLPRFVDNTASLNLTPASPALETESPAAASPEAGSPAAAPESPESPAGSPGGP